ncbi:MAG: NAD-dependent epimerase/dehydratase family protein, partial [Desulfobacteraceae bacterium]
WAVEDLKNGLNHYIHYNVDIRNYGALQAIFQEYGSDIKLVVHCAAQPSHDWACREPLTDFTINANGTLHLLELTRLFSPDAPFLFTSTNKVYGDAPNLLPHIELETRWEIEPTHKYAPNGIDETMPIDQSKHSLFGASKVSADVMVQEYGRYWGLKTACFRGGCLTGPGHSGAELHGFLSYLMKCALTGDQYKIFGYKGKQVRDNIHATDLVECFYHFYRKPRSGEVYNIGGGREANCSLMEAADICRDITGSPLNTLYIDQNRNGDHIWWVSDTGRFRYHYPEWKPQYNIHTTLEEIALELDRRLVKAATPPPVHSSSPQATPPSF